LAGEYEGAAIRAVAAWPLLGRRAVGRSGGASGFPATGYFEAFTRTLSLAAHRTAPRVDRAAFQREALHRTLCRWDTRGASHLLLSADVESAAPEGLRTRCPLPGLFLQSRDRKRDGHRCRRA